MRTTPYKQLLDWLEYAKSNVNLPDYNAMIISTLGSDVYPDSRVVLLKYFSVSEGLVFFTNYNSKKGLDIAYNNNIAAIFYWPTIFRQLRIQGVATKVSPEFSDYYFSSRSIESRYRACHSKQSSYMKHEHELRDLINADPDYASLKSKARPSNWGGYSIDIRKVEFWEQGMHREHKRVQYTLDNGVWSKKYLFP